MKGVTYVILWHGCTLYNSLHVLYACCPQFLFFPIGFACCEFAPMQTVGTPDVFKDDMSQRPCCPHIQEPSTMNQPAAELGRDSSC